MGFRRHFFLNWKIINLLKIRGTIARASKGRLLSILSNYAIPFKVAPQQSFDPLYVTVNTKVFIQINLLTLSFQQLVISYNNVVNENHENSEFYIKNISFSFSFNICRKKLTKIN
jgi:hypothetical protein